MYNLQKFIYITLYTREKKRQAKMQMSYLEVATKPVCQMKPDMTDQKLLERLKATIFKDINAFMKIILSDSTKTSLNLFYTCSSEDLRLKIIDRICLLNNRLIFDHMDDYMLRDVLRDCSNMGKYSIFVDLYKRFNGEFNNLVSQYRLKNILLFCIEEKEYVLFKLLYPYLTSGFYDIFYQIITYKRTYFMKIFAMLNRVYYKKMLNTRNRNTVFALPLDRIFPLRRTYVIETIGERNIREVYSENCYDIFTYMLSTGARSDRFDTRRFLADTFGPQIHEMLCKYIGHRGYKTTSGWKKLYKDDLIFRKILSYVV